MAKILNNCPTCQARMEVTHLSCTACDTVVLGRFEPCRFCSLGGKDLAFLDAFLRSKGNVKEMERELGISYWTIRGRINDLLETLGLAEAAPSEDTHAAQRREILERLQQGEISAAEANRLLTTLQEGKGR